MIGKTVVVGFGYKARRGKDSAVSAILDVYPERARRYAFADALKHEVAQYAWAFAPDGTAAEDARLGLPALCAWAGVAYAPGALRQRALWQWFGEYRRAQAADYWVVAVQRKIMAEQPEYALISDLRYFNERSICDVTVRMDRPGFEIDDGRHHISETQLDALDDAAWSCILTAADPEEVRWGAVNLFANILANRRALLAG
jgi:hypothetical protein